MKIQMEIESNEVENRPTRNAWQVVQTCFNVLNHIMACIVAIYMSVMCTNAGNKAVTWHVWLCTIGYQLLMTQAILVFYSENVWSKQCTRQSKKTIHWVLQAVGSSVAILGIFIEYIGRELIERETKKPKPHFSSTHSVIGLIAAIFTMIGMFNGISALWSIKLKKYARPVYFKLAHNLTGTTAFILGMIALFIGYDKGYMKKNSSDEIRLGLQILAIITVILSLIGAWRTAINHIRNVMN
ncbi:transmembrane reductase CYB561D2-like [Sitodiplosis mosellana]|uniref:transmembrane reductase CYB561D2-like n=1 Tax=Sitodiplosis mosellana TaxID=263140 RepID=UPI0024450A18|nr:transmembrane reductase CYB561D2-like [Sitodiplosis mosellana]